MSDAEVILYDGQFAVKSTGQPFPVRWASWSPTKPYALLACDRGRVVMYDGSKFESTDTELEVNLRG